MKRPVDGKPTAAFLESGPWTLNGGRGETGGLPGGGGDDGSSMGLRRRRCGLSHPDGSLRGECPSTAHTASAVPAGFDGHLWRRAHVESGPVPISVSGPTPGRGHCHLSSQCRQPAPPLPVGGFVHEPAARPDSGHAAGPEGADSLEQRPAVAPAPDPGRDSVHSRTRFSWCAAER